MLTFLGSGEVVRIFWYFESSHEFVEFLHGCYSLSILSHSCFQESLCRGIHLYNTKGGDCNLLYEIHDVLENQRLNYNASTVTADSENQILHKGKDTETLVRMGMSTSDKLEQSDIF